MTAEVKERNIIWEHDIRTLPASIENLSEVTRHGQQFIDANPTFESAIEAVIYNACTGTRSPAHWYFVLRFVIKNHPRGGCYDC